MFHDLQVGGFFREGGDIAITSMYFFALSQAPPVLDAEIAICNATD